MAVKPSREQRRRISPSESGVHPSPFCIWLSLAILLGQGKSALILYLQLLLNGINIVLDVVFVVYLDWGVAGIATATLIAEFVAAAFGLVLVLNHMRTAYGSAAIDWIRLKDIDALVRMLSVNRDIMIRTLCLIFAFAWFTNEGAKAGDVLLATNAILMQFVSFSAFFLDGYALAAESLVGVSVGAKNQEQYSLTLRYICELGFANSVLLSGIFAMAGPFVIDVLTNVPEFAKRPGNILSGRLPRRLYHSGVICWTVCSSGPPVPGKCETP